MALWLRVVRTRTITRPDCLHKLKKADLRGITEMAMRSSLEQDSQSYNHIIDAGVSMSSGHDVNCWHCQPSVECAPVSVHMCSASHLHLYLLVVNTFITRPL